MKTKQQYFYNALLLTAVTLLMRTVSVAFNVYISGKVGPEAMGLLSLVGGVYGFAVTLATSGIHLATVRTVAERMQKTGGAENGRCLRACLAYALFFGSLASTLLLMLARPIGLLALRDVRTVNALRMLALTLLPIAVTTVFNGYFTAVRRAFKNAIVQVLEQAIKISLTTYLLLCVAPKTVEGSMLAILFGGAVAESMSLLHNLLLYLLDKRCHKVENRQKSSSPLRVAAIALPVAISAYMRSGLLTIEHILIPRGLQRYGAGNSAALAAYGTIQGMALPVVLYPAAILSSFSALLIPEITEQNAAKNHREIRYIAGRAYQMALLFSIGAAAVMIFLSEELGMVLYGNAEAGRFISLLAPLIPVMYLDTATDALLKGLGEQVYSMNVNILDALVSVLAVLILVPIIGINGYVVTIYITELLNAALSICRLLKISGFRPKARQLLLRPLIAAVGATLLGKMLFTAIFPAHVCNGVTLTLHILILVVLYVLLLFTVGGLQISDVRWLSSSLFVKKGQNKTLV